MAVSRSKAGKERTAESITSSISEIYQTFRVPSSLQLHMMRVAAVGSLICDNWTGPKISKEKVVALLLIHDLGNIVKFTLDSPATTALPKEELAKIGYWRQVKADVIARYGADDHTATLKMAGELGASKEILEVMDEMGIVEDGDYNPTGSNKWELEICVYSDMRVMFHGVAGSDERIKDLLTRYKGTSKEPKFKLLGEMVPALEAEISQNMSIAPSEINDISIKPYLAEFQRLAQA
jgi:hypothetical protein